MSCEDIPSLLDLQNTKKHVDDFGRLMGVGTGTSTNEVTGQVRPTYNKVIQQLGFKPGSGDFTTGFTVMTGERDVAWYDPVSRNWYSYLGVIPNSGHDVLPGSNPVGDADWAPRTDQELRGELESNGSTIEDISKLKTNLLSPSGSSQVGYGSSSVEEQLDKLTSDIVVYTQTAGVLDDTGFINDILLNHGGIKFAPGVYVVDPDVGIIFREGSVIDGAGFMKSIIVAKQVGATISELASYSKGSIFKRAFTLGVANDYVSGVKIDNISIIMRHPTTINNSNYKQIALDLRNCDRSWVGPGLYVGNTTLPGMPFTWVPPRATQAQGYGIVYGTRNSNSVDYCGGVGGIAESPKVYGARKNIVVDEGQLSPQSAAHATIIRSPDLQIGVELISQGSQYNAGTVFEDCLLQSMQRFESTDVTIGLLIAGYNCRGTIRYLEGGPECDKISELTSSSMDSELEILYASVTGSSTALISDSGQKNHMKYRELTAVSGGKTTKGRLVETFDKGYTSRRVVSTFINTIGPQTVVGDSGVSVTRTGAGAYTITLDKAFSGEFGVNISAKTDASRNGFSFSYSSKTNNSIHVDTFVNNSTLDPQQMTIEIFQV